MATRDIQRYIKAQREWAEKPTMAMGRGKHMRREDGRDYTG